MNENGKYSTNYLKERPRFVRSQRMMMVNGILALEVLLVILQLWLLTATMNAYLGGDTSVLWPAAISSLVCFALNLMLLRYLYRIESKSS